MLVWGVPVSQPAAPAGRRGGDGGGAVPLAQHGHCGPSVLRGGPGAPGHPVLAGGCERPYIQVCTDHLHLNDLVRLQRYDPPVALVTLSACQTALGNLEAVQAEALRQAQLALIRGDIYTEGDQLVTPARRTRSPQP